MRIMTKRIVFILTFIATTMQMYGQSNESYHSLLKEGKTWNFEDHYYDFDNHEEWTKDVSYVINGTTEIDGKTYYKMYRISEEGTEYYSALREEDRKVWQYSSDDGDKLIYDFNMSVGDSYVPIDNWRNPVFKLVAIKPVQVHDVVLNVYHYAVSIELFPSFPELVDVVPHPIVEGVGCDKGWELERLFWEYPKSGLVHIEYFLSCYEDGVCIFTNEDFDNLPVITKEPEYVPFLEDGKVWKVGALNSGNPVQWVEYYYFDGDTIIDGKTCKQMMRQRYISPNFPEYDIYSQQPSLNYVGAWYEEDKKVYVYDSISNQFKLMYDFSLDKNTTLQIDNQFYMVGPKQTGGMKGFKGIYRDILMYKDGGSIVHSTPWLEGVGGVYGPTINVFDGELADPMWFLMSCTVGDEVIYLNDEFEDGATPEAMNARKRFDFTHTTKLQPKTPRRSEEDQSLYGEYNDKQLGINLDPLDEAYLVRITDETGKAVYEKAIDAGNIVALNVDISAYAKGRYTVTVENSNEAFTGEFEVQTTGIEEISSKRSEVRDYIYNLQGQRLSTLQKGLNIVNGKKVYVR